MNFFDILHLGSGEGHIFERRRTKERLFVGSGRAEIGFSGMTVIAKSGDVQEVYVPGDRFNVRALEHDTTLVRLCGLWGEEIGSCGVFAIENHPDAYNEGDHVPYPRKTRFDNHYHDCDEYWVIFRGQCIAVSEGRRYELGPGDCLATGMGHHHDLPEVTGHVCGVYFETTLEGKKRTGHLWNHTHGLAEPRVERV